MEIQIFVDQKQVIKFISVITLGIIDKYWISYVNFKKNCFSRRTYLHAPLITTRSRYVGVRHEAIMFPIMLLYIASKITYYASWELWIDVTSFVLGYGCIKPLN